MNKRTVGRGELPVTGPGVVGPGGIVIMQSTTERYRAARVGAAPADRVDYRDAYQLDVPPAAHPGTAPADPQLLYFTSGTTSRPKHRPAIEVFGGAGVSDDFPLACIYAWARRIVDGPDAVSHPRGSQARQPAQPRLVR